MKPTAKFISLPLLLVGILFVSSCKEKPYMPKEIAYYQFTPEDNQRLLPYKKGQVLKFTSQNGKERTFTIQSVNTEKIQFVISPGFMESRYYYYDRKKIELIDSETKWFYIDFSRSPIDDDLAKQDYYTKFPSKLYGSIDFFRPWNGGFYVFINYEQEKIEVTINGTTYQNVYMLSSGIDSIVRYDNGIGNIIYHDVNVIYYDEKEGIIGFDDLNGNKWRLVN